MKKFFDSTNNMQDYDYAFGHDFLKPIFGEDKYMRKYSMSGDGIYNLLLIDDKIYDLKLKEVKSMLVDDHKKAYRDTTKDYIVDEIRKALVDRGINMTSNSGKLISFKNNNKIFSVEITKKTSMPE
jgi:hypothetical protein